MLSNHICITGGEFIETPAYIIRKDDEKKENVRTQPVSPQSIAIISNDEDNMTFHGLFFQCSSFSPDAMWLSINADV